MLNKILKRADVKEFLHEVLMNERFHNKKSPLTPEGTIYGKSEYSLMFMMDALIKYSILFESDDLIDEYIAQLKRFMKKCENHRDLVEGVIRILAKMTAVTLNIDIEQIEQPENKRKILSYIYNRYITNGYLFHSFPSSYIEQVKNEGIDSLKYSYNIENFAKTNFDKGFRKYLLYYFNRFSCPGFSLRSTFSILFSRISCYNTVYG